MAHTFVDDPESMKEAGRIQTYVERAAGTESCRQPGAEIDRASARKGSLLMTHTLVDDPGRSWKDSHFCWASCRDRRIDQAGARKGSLLGQLGWASVALSAVFARVCVE